MSEDHAKIVDVLRDLRFYLMIIAMISTGNVLGNCTNGCIGVSSCSPEYKCKRQALTQGLPDWTFTGTTCFGLAHDRAVRLEVAR